MFCDVKGKSLTIAASTDGALRLKEKTLTIAISTDGVLRRERKDVDYSYLD